VRSSFGGKLFVAASAVGILTALVTAGLTSWSLRRELNRRIEERLRLETRLTANLIEHRGPAPAVDFDAEADRIGSLVDARVTFVSADGRVLGDSALPREHLADAEEHAHRPEILEARRGGEGRAVRFSTTVGTDMVYIAMATRHPEISYVRLAVPVAAVQEQLHLVAPVTLLSIAVAVPAALLLAWMFSRPLSRRVRAIADVARRYARGDLGHPPVEYGSDELGVVARTLDDAVQDVARRLNELASGRVRMEAILAGMVEGVLVVDAQGRVILANDAARRMLGVGDDAIGRHHTAVIRHPDVVAQIGTALRGENSAGTELALGVDAQRHFIARAAAARNMPGGDAVLVLHEITDLRKADQIRRDFVANVSHELRTPLTAIRGYVEALLDESPAPEARGFLEIIARHTARMERLVGNLLRLARLDARQEVIELTRTDLRTVIAGVLNELEPLIEIRSSRVDVAVDEEARSVVTDAAKLHDILRNLVENAVAYSPEGTGVDVTARSTAEATMVEVADSGPGIPASDLQRVFERFYRVDKSRGRNPGGTGLGLSIVKHLVELLNGSISATNRPEGGAVFTLVLPR
jgi:two-component system, OmpR family, phosphate regulon sensor histidine kinase PhoR